MFKVFGVTKELAKKRGRVKLEELLTRVGRNRSSQVTPGGYERLLTRFSRIAYNKLKPSAVSAELSTPEIARDFIKLANRTTLARNLSIKIKVAKRDGDGKLLMNKAGRRMFDWEVYDTTKDYSKAA
jgi:hypothetical protein